MNHSLKSWNTFGIDQNANEIVCAENEQQLLSAWQSANALHQPVLILGEGSNVLFLDAFRGTVIVNRIKGIEVTEQPDAWLLHVGAGENWHHLVQHTLRLGMPGLENLALIPGCVGLHRSRILVLTAWSSSECVIMLTVLSWRQENRGA